MKLCTAVTLVLLVLVSATPVLAISDSPTVRVIVGIERGHDYARAGELLRGFGAVELRIPEIGVFVLTIPVNAVERVRGLPFVRYVEEDKPVRALEEVQWNIEMVNATDVWSSYSTYGDAAYGYNTSIQVAVVDTGIDYTHKDLQNAVVWCVVSLSNGRKYYEGYNLKNCADPNGHGTHVAGIIAARLNGIGVAGVAPKAILYAVRVLNAGGSGYISDVAKGIIEATKGPDNTPGTDDDADVISMSLGGPDSQTLYSAVQYAYNYSVAMVAAAGNEGAYSPSCPACYTEVIAVGAIDQNYDVPSWSNRNPDVVAPGVNILSTWPKNRYAYVSGTSMACPHVSGVVALVQAIRLATGKQKLSPNSVGYVLTTTAIDLGEGGYDLVYGYGLVDAYAAVSSALSYP